MALDRHLLTDFRCRTDCIFNANHPEKFQLRVIRRKHNRYQIFHRQHSARMQIFFHASRSLFTFMEARRPFEVNYSARLRLVYIAIRRLDFNSGLSFHDQVKMKLKALVGSGDKMGLLVLPVLAIGLALNILFPEVFRVGGPPPFLKVISILLLIPGVTIWIWSVALILTKVPRRELITGGPYALVKHPLYTDVALLVLPWLGFLCDTWLGAAVGVVLYIASRLFSPAEEKALSQAFGPAWNDYCRNVKLPWL